MGTDIRTFIGLIEHIFLPPELPQAAPSEYEEQNINILMSQATLEFAQEYVSNLSIEKGEQWVPVIDMLRQSLRTSQIPLSKQTLYGDLRGMKQNSLLALHIRAQNACVVVRRLATEVVFEVFEVSLKNEPVMSTTGKLECSYPGHAVAIPTSTFADHCFLSELSSFLTQMDVDLIDDVTPKTRKAGTKVPETRDSIDSRYISHLLIAILGGLGRTVDVRRVRKRIADDVLWLDAAKPWRRAPLWLIIRVVLQTTLKHHHEYKSFMIFLRARLMSKAIEHGISSDMLFTMRAKVARGFYKLRETPTPAFVDTIVASTVKNAGQLLQDRWETIQREQAISPPWDPSSWNLDSATKLTLPKSYDYIIQALQRKQDTPTNTFVLDNPRRLGKTSDFSHYRNEGLTKDFADHGLIALHDFEESIHAYIDSWVRINTDSPDACETLASCFEQYQKVALTDYATNPEDGSIVVLTLMEIWVALDKITITRFPLLPQYVPDIPCTFLHPLLLRHSRFLDRAEMIEHYIASRHQGAEYSSVFSDTLTDKSISTRYFQQSHTLQELKSNMETRARTERESRLARLKDLNKEYTQLMSQSSALDHEYKQLLDKLKRHYTKHKAKSCSKCKLEKRARQLSITVHEWPLPSDRLQAERVVFELACPIEFSIWRNVTFNMLCTIGTNNANVDPADAKRDLPSSDLFQWMSQPSYKRITLSSTTKQFTRSHYRPVDIPAKESAVLLNHGSHWRLYDRDSGTWAANRFDKTSVASYGTYCISCDSPYAYLQHTLSSTCHTANEALAEQVKCPSELTLHEHIAYGTLRSGGRTQWLNVMRECASNALSFEREEVHQLLAQAVCQLGPRSSADSTSTREWHEVLADSNFLLLLLDILQTSLMGGSKLETSRDNQNNCYHRLSGTRLPTERLITYRWALELEKVIEARTEPQEIRDYSQRILVVAATCRITYDVDSHHYPGVFDTDADLHVYIHSAFIIHQHTPTSSDHVSADVQRVLSRDHRLRHRLQDFVAKRIPNTNQGLDNAVRAIWVSFRRNTNVRWMPVHASSTRWWTTHAANGATIHCNIFDGQFLVNGKPLGRLPKSYTSHETYQRIFGDQILDVIPFALSPMDFSSRRSLHGNQLSFAFSEDQLLVRASRKGTDDEIEILEVIPHTILADDLPFPLTRHYVHWLNLTTKVIEFRPLNNVWCSNDENLHLSVDSRQLTQGRYSATKVVDIHSSLFSMISTRLQPLEEAQHMVITYDPNSELRRVCADFPRSHLTFFVNKDQQLESGNTRGYIVDDHQAAGTLFGLTNQLILRKRLSHSEHTAEARLIVIPFGKVVSKCTDHHVSVHVNTTLLTSVEYHIYTVDDMLGCLASESGMKSWFYMLYLHAVTSHCLPDPLLNRTGTEEALLGLRSARSFSLIEIKFDFLEQLAKIATLSPRRVFYPSHLQSMQSTYWDPSLPPLSQHNAFTILVSRIFAHVKTLQVFHGYTFDDSFNPLSSSQHLTIRAINRCLSYYCRDFSDIIEAGCCDASYNNFVNSLSTHRDALTASYEVAKSSSSDLKIFSCFPSPIWDELMCWSQSRTITRYPSDRKLDTIQTFSYHRAWLAGDLESRWLEIYNLCRTTEPTHIKWRYQVVFTFSAMAYANPSMQKAAFMFMALIASHATRKLDPLSDIYTLCDGFKPSRPTLRGFLEPGIRRLEDTPSFELCQEKSEAPGNFAKRRDHHRSCETEKALACMVNHFIDQWPQVNLREPGADVKCWVDVGAGIQKVADYFSSCRRNAQLRDYFKSLEVVLSSRNLAPSQSAEVDTTALADFLYQISSARMDEDRVPPPSPPTLCHLLMSPLPVLLSSFPTHPFGSQLQIPTKLETILTKLAGRHHQSSAVCNLYANDLRRSCQVLEEDGGQRTESIELTPLLRYQDLSARDCVSLLTEIREATAPSTLHGHILYEAGQWPIICSRTLLQQLNIHVRSSIIYSGWPELLVYFAERFLEHQRSRRLLDHYLYGRTDEFVNERKNDRFDREEALRNPDWLLVQIAGNFLIRHVQAEIASDMIAPPSGKNTSLQLNMGEGKSSVIVPIVAATLANRKQLVRVIVLKSLSRQMFELLVQRLSHLCDRRVYYVPFSRHLHIGEEEMRLLQGLYKQCMDCGGILVVQPEHILSLKLMAVDRIISEPTSDSGGLSNILQETQAWLTQNSRDILDESDEILHVRYQLIYTIGHQETLQNYSDRWGTIQWVLHLVHRHALELRPQHPTELEVDERMGDFPIIRILSSSLSRKLSCLLADDAFNNRIPTLSLAFIPSSIQVIARRFLVESDIVISDYDMLKSYFEETGNWSNILLLRGLLSGGSGIINYALSERRWKVDYGHDLRRSRLAVPYRAKDVPSLRSEFGHPDVALTLTCLTYYYGGLTAPQLRQCFNLLYRLDNPALAYWWWVQHGHDIPETLQRLSGINIDDSDQFYNLLVPLFKNNSATADFFLYQVVFPQEAKTFPHKLTTTGWDLVEESGPLTTGFSGTNDNRFLMPTSITQYSRPEQESTNARVLSYLLQPENNTYFCIGSLHQPEQTLTAQEFLERLTIEYPDVRVLLDVGAQMIQLSNEALALCWLSLRSDVPAAVFFNEEDELTVVTKQQPQKTEPLHSSSFKQRLDECIVYLDDAHTRGTDLKLPRDARAVVTLGPKVTKDRLVQGCMRMRKLGYGTGQSLVFCAPPQIDRHIREIGNLSPNDIPEVSDIIKWSILETLLEIDRYIPQWAQQGVDHDRRQKSYVIYSASSDVEALREAWRQRESKTLEELYGMDVSALHEVEHPAFQLPTIRDRLDSFGITSLSQTKFGEEQEREVSQEVVQEREVERPPRIKPKKPNLHKDIKRFVLTGRFNTQSKCFIPVAELLPSSPAQRTLRWTWSAGLYVTRDFTRTVVSSGSQRLLDFMRPVNWVISGTLADKSTIFVIPSPHEVNELLPDIRKSLHTRLHIFNPRVTEWMRSFSDLSGYALSGAKQLSYSQPSLEIQSQLNLISGQLYLDNLEMYHKAEELLGIRRLDVGDSIRIKCDGPVLECFKHLVSSRRKGMGYRETHVGKMLHLRPLDSSDF
ncbi:hypothetical protein QCA50_015421 [Cerrena zonata]|uniref:ubiquitinyl hydrolase 1 n=1 Tax=Cerrena zonata TaxID=2478898 RepID=A0AAW0FIS9_9APHY